MEYILGFYLVGFILCALYISASIYSRPESFRYDAWYNILGIAFFTCIIWPVFLGHALYIKVWKEFKIL